MSEDRPPAGRSGGPRTSVGTARRIVMQLLEYNVSEAVLSPGSRSAALALALHAADAQGLLRLHVRVDEREAAFLALGMAKSSGRPVPVVTTSGTAAANLYPALLEAKHAVVPLIAITADRPARLRGTGANQTTVQPDMFPGIPTRSGNYFGGDPGPIHVNVEFDEPLVEAVTWDFPHGFRFGGGSGGSPTVLPIGPRTVVLAADGAGPAARELAEAAGWPLFAEPSSGSRGGPNLVAGYRNLLDADGGGDRIERVVSFGHSTLSRPVTRLLGRTDLEVVHVGDQSTFPLPAGPSVRFVDDVLVDGVDDAGWLTDWCSQPVPAALASTMRAQVARAVWGSVGVGDLLFVGASNPIRDLDLFAGGTGATVLANRGLSGIDGTISSAIGAALAGPGYPVPYPDGMTVEEWIRSDVPAVVRRKFGRQVAYIGDLTFLHGSNGLLIGPDEPRPDLTIVVLNDDGGGIFGTLEPGGADYADAFERVFATPTGADIGSLCAGYRVPHRLVAAADLADVLATPPGGLEVIEVKASR